MIAFDTDMLSVLENKLTKAFDMNTLLWGCRRLGTQVKVLPEQNEDLLPILSASNWEFYATMIHQCAEKP